MKQMWWALPICTTLFESGESKFHSYWVVVKVFKEFRENIYLSGIGEEIWRGDEMVNSRLFTIFTVSVPCGPSEAVFFVRVE